MNNTAHTPRQTSTAIESMLASVPVRKSKQLSISQQRRTRGRSCHSCMDGTSCKVKVMTTSTKHRFGTTKLCLSKPELSSSVHKCRGARLEPCDSQSSSE